MKVQKRNGTTQELDIAHIRKQTIPACEGLTNVSYEELELGAKIMFTDGITTKKIQEALIRSAESKIALDAPDWMYVAARLRLYDLYHRIKHYYGHTGADKDGDVYDKEKGLAMCITKKFFGNKGNFNKVFKKYIGEDYE